MIGRLFWVFTALFLGAAVHLGYVLFAPSYIFRHGLASLTENAAPNQFFLMNPETQTKLLPTASAEDIVGLCLLDLDQGRVIISANVPNSLWTLSIYSQSGQQVYAINDAEAGTRNFSIELKRAKALLQQLTSKGDTEEAGQIENVGWHAEIYDRRGIAVLWVPVPDQWRRGEIEAAIKGTNCEVKK